MFSKSKSSPRAKGPSQRQLRVAEQIRHLLSDSLRSGHFRDPMLQNAGNVTITSVDISPDLRSAHVYVMTLGGKDCSEIIKALNKAEGFFKLEISKKLELRVTPHLNFREDNSFDEAQHVHSILMKERTRLVTDSEEDSESEDE